MEVNRLHFNDTNLLRPLVHDYINQAETTKLLAAFSPDNAGIAEALEARRLKQPNREILVKALKEQYAKAEIKHPEVDNNIQLLVNDNCFTITTGHQLNLFGGTQYFIYKMVEVIKYCQQLKKRFPNDDFVPIFWLASEDHDFDEINHARIDGKHFEWSTSSKGAVGRFDPSQVLEVLKQLKPFFKSEPVTGKHLADIFEKAYTANDLATATRLWVHELFKEYGLIIIDGDDANLKSLFTSVVKQELTEQRTQRAIEETNAYLLDHKYHIQVYARPINLFYLHGGGRDRIIQTQHGYITADSEFSFSKAKMLTELNEHPERFSPNALMRPMYQETILPNLAYVGGAGEIAYWLQSKKAFEAHDVFFPQVVVRNSAVWLSRRLGKKLGKIGLAYPDFFQRKEDLIANYAESHHSGQRFFQLSKDIEKLWEDFQGASENAFHDLKLKTGSTAAEKQKELKKLRHDLRKIVKAKNDADLLVIHEVFDRFFPKGTFQERIDTFLPSYLQLGKTYFDILFEHIDPCGHRVIVLEH